MTNNNFSQVAFMPFAKAKTEFKISGISFWPFGDKQNEYIQDTKIRDRLNKIFETYITTCGQKIDSFTIASTGIIDFHRFSQAEIDSLEQAKYILSFICIEKNNKRRFEPREKKGSYVNWCTADNFEIVFQNFELEKDFIAPRSGAIHSITDCIPLEGAKFTLPTWINNHFVIDYDPSLLSALELCLDMRDSNPDCQKIIRSLEWFYDAYKNSHDVSHKTRIIMLSTAFETLLDLDDNVKYGKKGDFCIKIDGLFGNKEKPETKKLTIIKTKKGTATENLTEKQRWAVNFYELRSDIVHGDEIPVQRLYYGNKLRHFDVAELFFIMSVKKKLEIIPECNFTSYDEIVVGDSGNFEFKNGTFKAVAVKVLERLNKSA